MQTSFTHTLSRYIASKYYPNRPDIVAPLGCSIDSVIQCGQMSPWNQFSWLSRHNPPYYSSFHRDLYIRSKGSINALINRMCRINPLFRALSFEDSIGDQSDSIISELKRTGYAVLPAQLDVHNINSELDPLFNQMSKSKTGRQSSKIKISSLPLLTQCRISEVLESSLIYSVAARYLGVLPVLNMLSCWETYPFCHNSQSLSSDALQWHFDHDHNRFLKIFVYLTDVNDSSGPHQYIPRSSFSSLPPEVTHDSRYQDHDLGRHILRAQTVEGKAGTVIFADTLNIHRGTPVKTGFRRILQLQFVDSAVGTSIEEPIFALLKELNFRLFLRNCKHGQDPDCFD